MNVLTGFKFIGEQIGILEENGEAESYIFNFEESCVYLSGGYVRDKAVFVEKAIRVSIVDFINT